MCGIYGIISDEVIPFDKRMFCTLGINNDSRGGDSCGIFIDGKVEYGVDKNKYFIDFMHQSELLRTVRKCKCAIGHDRKASVGAVSLETAQPVVFKNSEGNIDFVVIHNGTIHNYLDLADKYIPDIDCTNMTDSQVMATIFYNAGYDCLAEYQGGAVFFIVDYREGEPKYLAWKGESKKTSYSKAEEDKEERPFFFAYTKNSTVFSSISTYLYVLTDKVWSLPGNTLIEFAEKDIFTVKEYNRDAMDQSGYQYDKGRKKVYTYPTNAYGRNQASKPVGTAGNVDDHDDNYYGEYGRWAGAWDNDYIDTNEPSFQVVRAIDQETDRSLVNIQYDIKTDLYTNNEKLCQGEYNISIYGYGPGYSGNKSNPKHYFWAGVHLCSREAFEFLTKMASFHRISPKELFDRYNTLVQYLSGLPYKLNHKEKGLWHYCLTYYTHEVCKDASVQKCFDGRKLTIKDGLIIGQTSLGYPNNYSNYKDRIKLVSNTIDYSKLKTIYLDTTV